jgi:N-acetylmuramoyl-L-alanine amidase
MNRHEFIILHCSASAWGDRETIDIWHKQKNWSGIGYNFVVCNGKIKYDLEIPAMDGSIEVGRNINGSGAHCLGYNHNSIGICMIGKDKFSKKQISSTIELISNLMYMYNIPLENVLGHYETPKSHGKTCPNVNMDDFRNDLKNFRDDLKCMSGII